METSKKNVIVLDEGYYLKYFDIILQSVIDRYSDLLSKDENAVVTAYGSLSKNAKLLLVRLLTRKGPWILARSLNYVEINISSALKELIDSELITDQVSAELADIIILLKKSELIEITKALGIDYSKKILKHDLLELLNENADPALLLHEIRKIKAVKITFPEVIQIIYLLFFGNFEQTLSEFIIQDVGNITYENYQICVENRLFTCRDEIEKLFWLKNLNERLDENIETEDMGSILEIAEFLLQMDKSQAIRVQRRYQKLLYRIGYILEQSSNLEKALICYEMSRIPPCRERIVRINMKINNKEEAFSLAYKMFEAPMDFSEFDYARKFIKRSIKKDKTEFLNPSKLEFKEIPEIELELFREPELKIEEQVINHLKMQNIVGWHTENMLIRAIFGLVFWDVIFAPFSGVFQHQFQRGPNDIRNPDFFSKRANLFSEGFLMMNADYLKKKVTEVWNEKYGIANLFVSWKYLSLEIVKLAIDNIPADSICEILQILSNNPKYLSCGFPDLFVRDHSKGTVGFIEVKGPGDTIRPKQRFWIERFNEFGIPAKIARVKWKTADVSIDFS